MSDRRAFLKGMLNAGVTAAGVVSVPDWLTGPAALPAAPYPGGPVRRTDPDPKALAWRAVEAARAAGAAYADVRLTYDRDREVARNAVSNTEGLRAGVRALVNGYWGFAASPYWTPDEMARLAAEAVAQAKTNALSGTRAVELGTIPVVRDGRWTTPVKWDPFNLPIEEVRDFLNGLELYLHSVPHAYWAQLNCTFSTQAKVFASTEGASFLQTVYATTPSIVLGYRREADRDVCAGAKSFEFLEPARKGWELVKENERNIRDAVPRLIAEIQEECRLPIKGVEVGRYDVVFDARTMSSLLAKTLGCATQLDRALGYEANATGTSYLNDPLNMVGSYQAGGSLLTVSGNRSLAGGLATVKWDDEGVEPDDITLVKDGVLADFQTTRESASWLKEYYAKRQLPVRSHGCAVGPTAVDAPLQHPPNLAMMPGTDDRSLDQLLAATAKGYLIRHATAHMDFQCLNGLGSGTVFELKNGRPVARIAGAGFLFRAPELWRGLEALGGPRSLRWYATGSSVKGEPRQHLHYTVGAVPAKVKQVAIIDAARKA